MDQCAMVQQHQQEQQQQIQMEQQEQQQHQQVQQQQAAVAQQQGQQPPQQQQQQQYMGDMTGGYYTAGGGETVGADTAGQYYSGQSDGKADAGTSLGVYTPDSATNSVHSMHGFPAHAGDGGEYHGDGTGAEYSGHADAGE